MTSWGKGRLLAATALLAACLLALGCGGSESDEDQIRDLVQRAQEAIDDRDTEELCSEILAPDTFPSEDCTSFFETAFKSEDYPPRRRDIDAIDIDGESARVTWVDDDGYTDVIKIDGEWYTNTID